MLRSIELFHVAVPLKTKIKHASHERTTSDNLIVRATLDSGHVGYGEGVPRSYVTGETIETTFAALSAFEAARIFEGASDFSGAVDRVGAFQLPETANDPRGMFGNAARCALELALLDAVSRKFDRSFTDAVRHIAVQLANMHASPQKVRYSGAITATSPRKERISAFKMRIYGFHQVKVKVGVAGQDDVTRMAMFRRILGNRMDIRIDANEAWSAGELIERVELIRQFRPTAIEQPVPHAEVSALAEMRPRLGIPVMLDESLCGMPDARAAILAKTCDLFNVRLSKCGGIAQSLQILSLGIRAGIGAQLGCHPGETGILSAAGRHFAANVSGLAYVEGSYDRHVLAENPVNEDLTFGYGGWAKPLKGPGLGVTINPETLARMTVARKEISYA